MIFILEDAYLGTVKKVKSIAIGFDDNGVPCLTMQYTNDDNKDGIFTSKESKREQLLVKFRSLVKQIKAQDENFLNQAFEDAIFK